ncbi:MAG: ECF transporter S component [Clostridia bacterium]|nr:ECF transporter S component [Clostridia bacterium]
MNRKNSLYAMVVSAVLLAVGMVLPFLTGQMQALGQVISPLHIPVLICGLCCGWKWGLAVGVVLPILRGMVFGMPPFPAVGLPMAFELGAYGLLTGLLYPVMLKVIQGKNHLPAMLTTLVIAMIGGRMVGGMAKAMFLAMGIIRSGSPFTFAAFIASYFTSTALGALIHVIAIPIVVLAIEKAKLSPLMAGKKD